MFNLRLPALILALTMGCTSCLFRKPSPRVFVPPPRPPRPPIPSQPPTLPPDPGIELKAETVTEIEPAMPPLLEPPPPPRRAATPPPPKPSPSPSAPPNAPEVPQPAAPKLTQIFTDDQLKEYNKALDDSLERVRQALAVVGAKRLNREQREIAGRVQVFQKQAEMAREQDLVTAVNLAKRADILAQDLLKRLP